MISPNYAIFDTVDVSAQTENRQVVTWRFCVTGCIAPNDAVFCDDDDHDYAPNDFVFDEKLTK